MEIEIVPDSNRKSLTLANAEAGDIVQFPDSGYQYLVGTHSNVNIQITNIQTGHQSLAGKTSKCRIFRPIEPLKVMEITE